MSDRSRGRINCFSCSSSQRDKQVSRRVTLAASPHSSVPHRSFGQHLEIFLALNLFVTTNEYMYIYSVRHVKAIVRSVNTWQKRCYSNSSSNGPGRPRTTCCKSGPVAAFTFHPKTARLAECDRRVIRPRSRDNNKITPSLWVLLEKMWQQIYKQCNRGRRWSI